MRGGVKRDWKDRALIVSLMVPCEETSWKNILARVEETEADGIELNFGCPHGMSERGMGSAVGQVPEYVEMVARWCKQHSRMPVIVKLTPNVTDVRKPARAAKKGGADAVSLINTINSICGIDLDHFAPMLSLQLTHRRDLPGEAFDVLIIEMAQHFRGPLLADRDQQGSSLPASRELVVDACE